MNWLACGRATDSICKNYNMAVWLDSTADGAVRASTEHAQAFPAPRPHRSIPAADTFGQRQQGVDMAGHAGVVQHRAARHFRLLLRPWGKSLLHGTLERRAQVRLVVRCEDELRVRRNSVAATDARRKDHWCATHHRFA